MDIASSGGMEEVRTNSKHRHDGVIHRRGYDPSSIPYLSIDGVGYAVEITLERGLLWLGCKVRRCEERRGIRLGCDRRKQSSMPGLQLHLRHVPLIQSGQSMDASRTFVSVFIPDAC